MRISHPLYFETPLEGVNKTPITYWGGKQRLVPLILSLIPTHKLYCEPFVGGGAVLFAKEPSEIEVINDLNGDVVNFYRVCHHNFTKLQNLIKSTPHSRQVYRETLEILKKTDQNDPVKRAWALWTQANMSFAAKLFHGYAYERKSSKVLKTFLNKKIAFTPAVRDRLEMVDMENNDAFQVIKSRDTDESFFYCDPPYFNSTMGHYDGYTKKDFEELLSTLSNVKGSFLLSSYPSDILDKYTRNQQWSVLTKKTGVLASKQRDKMKIEVLTANYDLEALPRSNQNLSGINTYYLHLIAQGLMLRLNLKGNKVEF